MNNTGTLSLSNYGRFIPNRISKNRSVSSSYSPYEEDIKNIPESSICSFTIKQRIAHERPFVNCKFDLPSDKLYLIDSAGDLIQVSLAYNEFSSVKGKNVLHFAIDTNNSYSLILVTKNSELHHLSFENKKTQKIMNLNMNRIRAFERNYLRNMILALDYQILFLCDLANKSKIKSLKAQNGETFTNACFASNNRFIILAVKLIEIRILEIDSLKTVHSIKLPFPVQGLRIQTSYDSKKIAIYGNCPIVFFISIGVDQKLSYQLLELPFLRQVKQMKYTYTNDIILLGADQILYIIPETSEGEAKIYPIFNQQRQVRGQSFDVSVDCKTIAVVSNRTVFTLKFQRDISSEIRLKSDFLPYREIQFIKEGDKYGYEPPQEGQKQGSNSPQKKIQYESDDQQEDESPLRQRQKPLKGNSPERNSPPAYVEYTNMSSSSLLLDDTLFNKKQIPNFQYSIYAITVPSDFIKNYHIDQLPDMTPRVKQRLYQIISQLNKNTHSVKNKTYAYNQKRDLIGIVFSLYKLFPDDKNGQKCFKVIYSLLKMIQEQSDLQKIEKLMLVFCPQVLALISVRRFNGESIDLVKYFGSQMKKLFIDYFTRDNWVALISYLLNNYSKNKDCLVLCFIVLLKQMKQIIQQSHSQNWNQMIQPSEDLKKAIVFSQIARQLQGLYQQQRYQAMLSSGSRKQLDSENQNNSKNTRNQIGHRKFEGTVIQEHQRSRQLGRIVREQQIVHDQRFRSMAIENNLRLEELLRRQQQIRGALVGMREKRRSYI